jgi:hypothetical protein
MADGRVEVGFSAQWLADKIVISGVNECKCCFNLKRELKQIQVVQLKSGPYFNISNLFTKIYMLYYTNNLYLQ